MKKVPYFSHDINAVFDEKISYMRDKYGMEGYGVYWAIIEKMRESEDSGFTLPLSNMTYISLKQNLQPKIDIKEFIEDCINEYHLFESDGECFWSKSLRDRMAIKSNKSETLRANALQGVAKRKASTANAEQLLSNCSPNAEQYKDKSKDKDKDKNKDKNTTTPLPPSGNTPPAITLTFDKDGQCPIAQDQIDEWQNNYPMVDVPYQLKRIQNWFIGNPYRCKSIPEVQSFITNWLEREVNIRGSTDGRNSKNPDLKSGEPPGKLGIHL